MEAIETNKLQDFVDSNDRKYDIELNFDKIKNSNINITKTQLEYLMKLENDEKLQEEAFKRIKNNLDKDL